MKKMTRVVRAGLTVAMLVASVPALRASADVGADNKPTPAFVDFERVWSRIADYSETVVTHETTNDGKATQDRSYTFLFVKPNAARVDVTAGPGKGGSASWHGGDTITGHQGGFLLSRIKLTIPKTDPRAVSLRGDQIDSASYGHVIEHFRTTPGQLVDTKNADGSTTVTFTPAAPEASGVTRESITLDAASRLPVRYEEFVGPNPVKSVLFKDVRVNEGKTGKDIGYRPNRRG